MLFAISCAPAAPQSAPAASSGGSAAAPKAAKPQFPDNSTMAAIQKRGKLLVGTKDDVPGIGYLNPKTNQMEGFSVDLGESLAEKIFGEPGHLEAKGVTAATRIPTLQDGTVDVNIETTFITEQRKQQADFADPYWGSGSRVFVRADNTTIHGPQDLEGQTVSTTKGSTGVDFLKPYPGINFLLFDTTADAVEAVKTGRAVATAFDEAIGLSYMKDGGFKFAGDSFQYNYYGVMVKKGATDWVDFINKWEQEVKTDGTWKKLFAKNFPGADVPDPPMAPFDKAPH